MLRTQTKKLLLRSAKKIQLLLFISMVFTSEFTLAQEPPSQSILLHTTRLFDGINFRTNASILIKNGKIVKVAPRDSFKTTEVKVIDLGNATVLPGFIELHAHSVYKHIPPKTILRHGITTIRDVGGPLHKPYGGKGTLRRLTSGPILTAPNGYPIPNMGAKDIAVAVSTEEEARKTVQNLVEGGAVFIKIALEPGGEKGAPWSTPHGHGHNHQPAQNHTDLHNPHKHSHSNQDWPLLSEKVVKAIVDEAHKNNTKVTAHVAEEKGVKIAVYAGVDEWAHMPCNPIPQDLLKKAVSQNVRIVATIDTLSKCSGIARNAEMWSLLSGEILYGAEIAHPDVPWGIDAQELFYMMQFAKMKLIDVLRSATSKAGRHLNIPLLGTLRKGAPADIIAVKGDPAHNLKLLEYPDLVISGGVVVVNQF